MLVLLLLLFLVLFLFFVSEAVVIVAVAVVAVSVVVIRAVVGVIVGNFNTLSSSRPCEHPAHRFSVLT